MQFLKNLLFKPVSLTLTVSSSHGFHLRPVAKFVSVAKNYPCLVEATFTAKTVDAKSINKLLTLALEKGDTFTLTCQGKQAQEALNTLEEAFATLMQDDKSITKNTQEENPYHSPAISGQTIYEGIAIAKLYTYKTVEMTHEESYSFTGACQKSMEELDKADASGIYLAQKELLVELSQQSTSLSELEKLIDVESSKLQKTKLEAKIADYQDILTRVKKHLGQEKKLIFPNEPFILLSDDLLPSEIELLSTSQVTGVILKNTSLGAHAAILLRASGIPSLIADIDYAAHTVILDTFVGILLLSPSKDDRKRAEVRLANSKEKQGQAYEKRFEKVINKSGIEVDIFANITDLDSAKVAKQEGAQGIGLFRTEFLFKEEKPTFNMQVEAYEAIFDHFEDVTIRTLDVGGDKALPYVTLDKEENPFLGIRGIRLFKTHPELMEEQLLAILTASGNRAVKIIFPMVSCVLEFIEVKKLAHKLAEENSLEISNIQFGIMIEVPSTLFLLEAFNTHVDFYSIGTNDLTQYLFAIERTHSSLVTDPLSSVVFDALQLIVDKTDKPVSICGELASNKEAIPKLLSLGIKTLSVSPKTIAQTKETIRNV